MCFIQILIIRILEIEYVCNILFRQYRSPLIQFLWFLRFLLLFLSFSFLIFPIQFQLNSLDLSQKFIYNLHMQLQIRQRILEILSKQCQEALQSTELLETNFSLQVLHYINLWQVLPMDSIECHIQNYMICSGFSFDQIFKELHCIIVELAIVAAKTCIIRLELLAEILFQIRSEVINRDLRIEQQEEQRIHELRPIDRIH